MLTAHEKQQLSALLAMARGRIGADALGDWVTEARHLLTAEAFDHAEAFDSPRRVRELTSEVKKGKKKKDAQAGFEQAEETATDGDV